MRTFHYKDGHEDFSTMTVGELRAELSKYPDETPVLATWEGIFTPFRPNENNPNDTWNFFSYEFPEHGGWQEGDLKEKCLIIDVNQ